MYYLTTSNFFKFLQSLDLDIPRHYHNEFFSNYKLKDFEFDLNHCTKSESHVLVIGDFLYKDTSSLIERMTIAKISVEQDKWINPLGLPRYHCDKNCISSKNSFENMRMPKFKPEYDKEANKANFRKFFKENHDNYARKDGARDPRIFCRKIIEQFGVTDTLEELESMYFNSQTARVTVSNSKIVEVTEEKINKELEKTELVTKDIIDKLLIEFRDMVKDIDINYVKKSFLFRDFPDNTNKLNEKLPEDLDKLSDEMKLKLKNIFDKKREIVRKILRYYFDFLFKNGLDISEKTLIYAGFQKCHICFKEHK
ncbi:hypothetical protein [Actinobacillus pleuropneumoniae]|uniref:Uncharacterized protein n=2 Tax=Actinobacillus pleuropneumoniae TaxID=715 RepID=A0ABM6X5I6_ACTPL|nr:hypothetical protein [Actinobacillus pleuropneumoniae]ASU15899.1 hypothetical protein CHY23_01142 [Actinobacillus pleuropneumoniae]AWG96425.1 hypothetical protein APPSER1_10995 [Actinobacillus pleuropneumoniae serovar 1 str. 4074]AXA22495.1 hypothetical protein DRF63_10990 [Actinobacillus pleuropneumoniae]EFM97529.1 hypothetical protein appser11_21780 [Actinobacillus pleuropneumoniae serovar 11 str. 56153]MCI1069258.1 hypothetical protein [Actinobacillus pleuropneumoniae]